MKKIDLKPFEALSDGIFAVVMTLTIFEFKVQVGGNLFSSQLLLTLVIYMTTFIVLTSIWNSHHHRILTFLREQSVDELLLWVNYGILLIATFFPFVTVAHAEYPHCFVSKYCLCDQLCADVVVYLFSFKVDLPTNITTVKRCD